MATYRKGMLIFMMTSFKAKIAGAAVAAVLVIGGLAMMAPSANATTGTCLGTQNPVSGSISCGSLYLPGMDPVVSGQPNAGTLSLTAASDYWNAPITFTNSSGATTDFTVYERCTSVGTGRTEANPCGAGGTPVLNLASNRPEFVAEVTPLGKHLDSTTTGSSWTGANGQNNLCISWEALPIGPQHKLRIQMVERTCNSFGATFYAGIADGLGTPPNNTGVPPVVTSPNPYQTFAAIPGSGGNDLIANDVLSHNFLNHLWVVDDQAFHNPGNALLYPENDGRNQLAAFFGCNGAVLTTGVANSCP